jgi:hypothetical protein
MESVAQLGVMFSDNVKLDINDIDRAAGWWLVAPSRFVIILA